jgi:hypothetical protein
MSALPGVIGLLIVVYMRPHEFFRELKDYNLLYVFLLFALIGLAHDISERRTKLMMSPLLKWGLVFLAWCATTLLARVPNQFTGKIVGMVVSMILMFIVGHAIQRLDSLMKVAWVVFAIGLFVAYVGADQGLSPFECIIFNPAEKNGRGWPDGRLCDMKEADGTPHDGTMDCISTGKPGVAYACEHSGMLGTSSVGGGRVRYLGVLMDPNELALATALIVPFAFAFLEIRPNIFRLALLLLTILLVAVEIVFTSSRGGQVAFGAVLGAYFVKKYGWTKGMIVGAALALPIVAMGGRSGDEAEHSTLERLGCAAAGIQMAMNYPVFGVGFSQFTEHHFLTAHNAYILSCGELGILGFWLFAFMLFLAIKIPVTVLRFEMLDSPETRQLKALAMGLLAAFIGMEIGIFFLSWTYHYVLWIHFGLVTALWSVMKRLYPSFEVKLTWKEARLIMFACVAFLVAWSIYIKRKGAWDV